LVRDTARLSREEFAGKLGVTPATIGRYEKSERVPDADFLCKLVQLFDCDPGWLLIGGGSMWTDEPREINEDLLQTVIIGIEESERFKALSFPSDQKAEFVIETYHFFQKDKAEKPVDKELVKKMINAFYTVCTMMDKGVKKLSSEEMKQFMSALNWKD